MLPINRENEPRISVFDNYYDDSSSEFDETEEERYVFKELEISISFETLV